MQIPYSWVRIPPRPFLPCGHFCFTSVPVDFRVRIPDSRLSQPVPEIPEPVIALPEEGNWYVLHTKSRQEKALAADLAAMGVGYYLPLHRQPRFHGRRKVQVELPLFPGYVFMRGELDQAYEADRTRRVARIIPVTEPALFEWELRNISLAIFQEAPLDPYPYLAEGTRVEVRSGPFKGLQGRVELRRTINRLVLQVGMLGRAMSIEIDASLLDPLR